MNIDFGSNQDYILVRLDLKNITDIIFYVLNDGQKIFIKHLPESSVQVPKKLIQDKKIYFQFYFFEKGVKKQIKSSLIAYSSVDNKSDYGLILGKNTYDILKKEGYYSVDKAYKIDLNESIVWHTPHRNFNFNINALRFLSSYWASFFKTFDYALLKEIYGILEQYLLYMKNNDIRKDFVNYDMAIGIRALHISLMFKFEAFLSKEELANLNWLYNEHVQLASNPHIFKLNNHGVWLMYGLRMLLEIKNHKNHKKLLKYCTNNFQKLLDNSFNKENVCTENSPFYHQYNIDLYRRIPIHLFSDCHKLIDVVKDGEKITPWFTDGNGYYYQIGDTEGKSRFPFLVKQHSNNLFECNEQSVFVKLLIESGYLIVKSFDIETKKIISEFIFSNSSDSYVHKHVDGNSFIYFYKGIEVFADAGKYAYEFTKLRDYFISGFAHNTIVLDGTELVVNNINLKRTQFTNYLIDKNKISLTSQIVYKGLMMHERTIIVHDSEHFIIKDKVKNSTSDNIVVNFLFGEEIEVDFVESNVFLKFRGSVIGEVKLTKNYLSKKCFKGSKEPYKGWLSKEYKSLTPTCSLEVLYPAKTAEIFTEVIFLDE